jgi:hypothetical protein
MGKAKSDIIKDQENANHRKVHVQWWVLVRKGTKNDEELYYNWWFNKWKCNHADPKQWLEISSITFFFWAKSNSRVNSTISINVTHASKVKANFDATNNNSCTL